MDLGLSGRRAIVLAASDGLGRASAAALVREGVDVAICGRREDALATTRDELASIGGGRVLAAPCDVADLSALAGFVTWAVDGLGGLDVLVTNAGGPPGGRFDAIGDDAWRSAFDLLVLSTVGSIRTALPALRASDQGRIISIVSSSVRQPIANLLLSNALRPAVIGLLKTLAEELAPDGILCNAVAPGRVDTARVRSLDRSRAELKGVDVTQIQAETRARIPLGRYGEPDEVGDVVAFLASRAARYMTGQTLLVDGGMVSALP